MSNRVVATVLLLVGGTCVGQERRPYRLEAVDLKQRVIWGVECRGPDGTGLAFGGQDQDADDGRPHTRLLVDGEWVPIHRGLRKANPLQPHAESLWRLRDEVRDVTARLRHHWFEGRPEDDPPAADLVDHVRRLRIALAGPLPTSDDSYHRALLEFARGHLDRARRLVPETASSVTAAMLRDLHVARTHVERAAEALDAEPPPRALDCGGVRGRERPPGTGNGLVFEPKTGLYVLFGGDHLDYLTNDTWVFDPEDPRWVLRRPTGAPPPRANHRMDVTDDGRVVLTGGYTYASNTDYLGGQYVDLDDGTWTYDVERNVWSGEGTLVPHDTRVYRTGPFHPDHYLAGDRPDSAAFAKVLGDLPANRWVATNPPIRPRLNRDWGVARIDPHRDLMLRWSGGHSAHGGTDVPHFHFATNRWELPLPVEFPLGQLYSNTSYPGGFNFNLRPWMTGHTYQNYAYDPPSRTMVKAGRPRHFYVYDPDRGDWTGRGPKPEAMCYGSCFYTLTLAATPAGAVCWDRNGRVHRYDHRQGAWVELELTGDDLPGAYVDNSSMAYDSKRNRLLIVNTEGYRKPFLGHVHTVDLESGRVTTLAPAGQEAASRLATIDRCCYVPDADLLLFGTYLRDSGDHTPTPAYDCVGNRWITLDLAYETSKRGNRNVRAFPHRRSDALMWDAKRRLVWGVDTNGQVYVLRLATDRAGGELLSDGRKADEDSNPGVRR